jgi:hypothetical protein
MPMRLGQVDERAIERIEHVVFFDLDQKGNGDLYRAMVSINSDCCV